ncbi:MAG TPA: 3-oxoacid CoA-transferase subunit B [Negativicutes bacterium]|nr:3-oxoacid CoA-transferase subunit B [Negativicutes bacterium]
MLDVKNFIAKRVAYELNDGDVVNLGIGIPSLVANHVPKGKRVFVQTENGILGQGPAPATGQEDKAILDASSAFTTVLPGGKFYDSAGSFGLIRGGHVDVTVLGALQVDERGNLANWHIPGKMLVGIGGAMDLVTCAKKVIVAMEHTAGGKAKIMKKCTYPLTAPGVVDVIITEMGVIDVTEKGLVLREIAPWATVEGIQAITEAPLKVSDNLKDIPTI